MSKKINFISILVVPLEVTMLWTRKLPKTEQSKYVKTKKLQIQISHSIFCSYGYPKHDSSHLCLSACGG